MNTPLAAPRAQGGNGVDWKHFVCDIILWHFFDFETTLGKLILELHFDANFYLWLPSPSCFPFIFFSRRKIWVQEFLWVPTEMVPINFLFLRKLPWLSNSATSWQPLGNLQLRDSKTLSLSAGEMVDSSVFFPLPVHSRRSTLFNPFLGSLLGPLENLNSWTFHNPPPFIFHRHHHWRSIYCFSMTWWDPRIAEGCSENGKEAALFHNAKTASRRMAGWFECEMFLTGSHIACLLLGCGCCFRSGISVLQGIGNLEGAGHSLCFLAAMTWTAHCSPNYLYMKEGDLWNHGPDKSASQLGCSDILLQ